MEEDWGIFLDALRFAARKHREQRRQGLREEPYINHPIALAETLWRVGGVRDPKTLAVAVLHDTIEDTATSPQELEGRFGIEIADAVVELTDVGWLEKTARKELQVSRADRACERAKLVKLADKISNLESLLTDPPPHWPLERTQEYFDWAKRVVDRVGDVNPALLARFEALYRQRPGGTDPAGGR
jgi:GTP diphosphokinase / guanosine-3',5'-bis(diphosphate) 3'-diphosphatase